MPRTGPPKDAIAQPFRLMTGAEQDVLIRLADGLIGKEIADEFQRSAKTIESHVTSLLEKTGARNRAHLVALGFRAGVLK